MLLDGVSSFCLKARPLCPWKTPTSPVCIAEVKVMPAFPSKIPQSSSLLCFPAFFCPDFYNSAVRNCFWAETWQQKSDLKPGTIPLPSWFFKTLFFWSDLRSRRAERRGRAAWGIRHRSWLAPAAFLMLQWLFIFPAETRVISAECGRDIFVCVFAFKQKTAESFLL